MTGDLIAQEWASIAGALSAIRQTILETGDRHGLATREWATAGEAAALVSRARLIALRLAGMKPDVPDIGGM